MKLLLSFFLLLNTYSIIAQRYLSAVFPSVDSIINIQYGNAVNYQNINENLLLDFYEPQGDPLAKRPLIIYVHGGGFQINQGDKTLPHIKSFCKNFAKKGYNCASIDYRLDTAISGVGLYTSSMRAMHDAKAAVRFFRKNAAIYKVDTNNIFIGGESAGGVTSLLVSYVDDITEIYAGTVVPYTTEGSSGNPGFSSKVKACLGLCAFMWDTTYIDTPNDPKLLIMHGTADPIVDWHQSLNIYTRAHNIGLQNTFKLLNGATHCPWYYGLSNSQAYADTLEIFTALFLYQYNTATGIDNNIQNINSDIQVSYLINDAILIKATDDNTQIETIKLYATDGKLVSQKDVHANHTIILNEGLTGLYLLKIVTNRGVYSRKIFFDQ